MTLDNLLACPRDHVEAVFAMLRRDGDALAARDTLAREIRASTGMESLSASICKTGNHSCGSEMNIGDRVTVISAASGSDRIYTGRCGVVIPFDPALPWTCPRALLAPEQFVCVHLEPRNALERKRGSPVVLLNASSLKPDEPTSSVRENEP
jgi:hypothetical protein